MQGPAVMSTQHHVIRREVLKVAVEGTEADGFALHRKLGALCSDWLVPALDEALSRDCAAGRTLACRAARSGCGRVHDRIDRPRFRRGSHCGGRAANQGLVANGWIYRAQCTRTRKRRALPAKAGAAIRRLSGASIERGSARLFFCDWARFPGGSCCPPAKHWRVLRQRRSSEADRSPGPARA